MGWPRLFKIMSFFFFYKGRSSRYTVFSGGILILSKIRPLLHFGCSKYASKNDQLLGRLIEIIFPLYSCNAEWLFLQYKKNYTSLCIIWEVWQNFQNHQISAAANICTFRADCSGISEEEFTVIKYLGSRPWIF